MSIFKDSGINSVYESSDIVSIAESASETYKTIEVLEEGVMNYTPSMVPVHARKTGSGVKYIVEMDMLQKLSCYSGMSISEAYTAVCEENNVNPDDTYVVMDDPEDSLEQKVSASIAADAEDSIAIDNQIQNEYADIRELEESGVNIIVNEGFIANMKANPELKKMWKDMKKASSAAEGEDGDEGAYATAAAKIIKSMYNKAESIEDYKFVKSKASKISPEIAEKCAKKIDQLKEEKHQMRQDTKEYRRDQLKARREEKRKIRAEKRAAKAATSED